MKEKAIGIIDAQRGFMPKTEGERLKIAGFGELPVINGEQIVNPINRLLSAYIVNNYGVFTTQDWHPAKTAHFNRNPNFQTTWPVHCVAGTPGAELHPNIKVPKQNTRFLKGYEPLDKGEDDNSYSGYYALNPETDTTLPQWLKDNKIKQILLGGLALDYCVGKTALDIKQKLDIDVIIALDGTRYINTNTTEEIIEEFNQNNIKLTTSEHWISEM